VFHVSTKFPEPWKLVSLQRKIDKTNHYYQYGPTLKLNIKSIDKVSREQVKCIYIDDPDHLYVTDNYVVTHNTIMTATLSKICEKYGRTITIVPNKSLVEQTEEDFINVGLDVGVYYGDRKDLNKTHTICTWQSLNILDKKSKNSEQDILTLAEFLENVSTVIVDEVHQAKAEVLKNLLTQNLRNAPIRWGLTGTVPKEDLEFENIRCSLGNVINRVSASELQEKGVLSNCHVHIVQTQEWKEFESYPAELKYLVTDDDRLEWMSKIIKGIALNGNTLVLVDRIESGKFLQTQLSELFSLLKEDPDVKFISGAVKTKNRKEEYKDIATADNKIIIATYGVAAVGINIPRLFNIVLIEPGKSFVRVIQSIGRGLRKAEDKDFVDIYDITANTKYSKRHLTERKRFYKEANYKFSIEKVKR
jgi:superfamily II DNA or RNA helicase